MSMFRSLLPESLFPRKLSTEVEQRLRLAQARADEAIVRVHVDNALLFVDALAPDVPFERALDIYVREMGLPDPAAAVVLTRALVALGDGVIPERGAGASPSRVDVVPDAPTRPRLRLDDAVAARRRLA
jgi:hypothetical protein